MPTNVPPEYKKIEARYREATSNEERIAYIEEILSIIPKHKGTDHLRADWRRRHSKLKDAAESSRKGGAKQSSPFHVDKEGAGQVAVIGPRNVGKSSLLAALSNATPDIADYPFTTQIPAPGMMTIENIQVQLIDTPPLSGDFADPLLIELIKRADLVMLMVDLQAYPIAQFQDTLASLQERHIVPEQFAERYPEGERLFYKPFLALVNKVDDPQFDEEFEVLCELIGEEECPLRPISAQSGRNLDELKQVVFDKLDILRVYSKPPGKEPDFAQPFVLKRGDTVEDFALSVHKDFAAQLKSARVWGTGVFDGQQVGRDHVLHEGDIVELRL